MWMTRLNKVEKVAEVSPQFKNTEPLDYYLPLQVSNILLDWQ
jgi:hypothetical protein